jgi:hypothetical protein
VEWQRAREAGALSGLTPKHRKKRTNAERELDLLRRRNEKLEDQLVKHRVALEAQGKVSELLAQLLAQSTPEKTQQPEDGPTR